MSSGNYSVDERTQILLNSSTPTPPPTTNDCSCCITQSCCQTYNRIGIFFFVIWFSLQIVSVSTSWHEFYIFFSSNDDRMVLSYLAQGVSISRFYQQSSQIIQASIFCPYDSSMGGHNQTNILNNHLSRTCPPSGQLSSIFPPIVGTSVVAIIAEFAMIIWLAFRSTKKGIDYLFNNKCSTQIVSIILSVFIIGFSSATFALLPGRLGTALVRDYGEELWTSLGCYVDIYSSSVYLNCRSYSCSYYPCTIEQDGAGYFIAIVNMALLCLGVFYTWIGSWCCSCCSCMEDPNSNPYSLNTYTGGSTAGGMVTNQVPFLNTAKNFTLFVHHGSPLPTKLVLMASTFQELHAGIAQNIGVTVPFSIAVFDEQVKQYVMVTSLAAIPPQATVQLMFQ